MKKKDEIKVCLVGSSGGHLTHLYMLKPFWKDKNRFWVTFDKEDARSLLEGEKVYPCYFPTNRSIKALIKNTKIAWDVLHRSMNRRKGTLHLKLLNNHYSQEWKERIPNCKQAVLFYNANYIVPCVQVPLL